MEEKSENIVKKVCRELGLTYRELGERIGVSETTLKSIASTDKVSLQIQKAIELYMETVRLKKEAERIEVVKKLLGDIFK